MKTTLMLATVLCITATIGVSQAQNNPNYYNKPITETPKGYQLVEELSDEFNTNTLDTDKWETKHGRGGWKGRGARFMPENVSVKDGSLQLRPSLIGTNEQLKKLYQLIEQEFVHDKSKWYGESLDPETWDPQTYGSAWRAEWGKIDAKVYSEIMSLGLNTIGAASVMTKKYGKQGLYEARIKSSKIPMSSAFWTQGHNTEFDITESCGGRSVTGNSYIDKFPYKVQTSVWINARNWNGVTFRDKGGVPHQSQLLEYPMWSEYIVLGLKWEEKLLTVYVNDKEVYNFPLEGRVTSKDGSVDKFGSTPIGTPIPVDVFAEPQQVIFDSEMLWGPDHGWPVKSDLMEREDGLNIFYIDWVRVWEPIDGAWSDELYGEK